MPSTIPPQSKARITPRQLLQYNRLGTGVDLNLDEYQDYLLEYGLEVAREVRRMIHELTGFTPAELNRIASTSKMSATIRTRGKIRSQLMKMTKRRPEDLRQLSDAADDYIREISGDYFPGEEAVEMNDEVATCIDPAKLVLRAFNDRLTAKIKFEAARKLLLMKLIAEVRDCGEQCVDHEDALDYMTTFFNERILKLPEGHRVGDLFDRYLISQHEGEKLRTTSAEFRKEKPNDIDPLSKIRVTFLECRRAIVKDKTGREREIFFRKHPRKKTSDSRLTKALRYGTSIGEKDVDRNGIRLVFSSREDWEDFFKMFKSELKQEIEEGLREELETETDRRKKTVLESRLRSLEQSIIIHDVKDSLDGNGFRGSAHSSSPELKVYKFKLELTLADGRQHHYEFQVFLPDGYADSMYRKGVSWDEYNVDRFFRENVDELLFPAKIYPKLDREKAREKVMKQAHRKVWNGNGDLPPDPTDDDYEERLNDTDERGD